MMIGILPTLDRDDLVSSNLSDVDRYTLLNDQIVAARGEDFVLDIDGVERLVCTSKSIAPEAACTSVQLRLQVTPARFADVWNAAQAVAAVQVAIGANSPFLFGRELWRESRPPLFQQSTDTRPPELQAQGVRPRTWFGERWISSAYDLFEENLRFFPPLLPISDDEDPLAVLDAGGIPGSPNSCCTTARSTGWNRPSTTSPTIRTCASRTGCCPPVPPSPMSSPTRRSTTGSSVRSPRRRGPVLDTAAVRVGGGQLRRGLPSWHRRATGVAAAGTVRGYHRAGRGRAPGA